MEFPESGMTRDQVLQQLKEYQKEDIDWRAGTTFGFVFHATEDATRIVEEAFHLYLWHNGLDPTVYRSLFRLETEVVAMARDHLRGDREVVGNFTSGGTESIILAVKAARDRARAENRVQGQPEIVLPRTAHAAFQKAAHYLGMKVVIVPVDPETFAVRPDDMRAAIGPNTALIVGSATSFSHGVMDPIGELSELALEKDLWLHVDGCIGGFMLPFFRELGTDVPPFSFELPGVSSISMDFHKYAFAAKGASVVLFRNKGLRRYALYSCSGWTGYTIVNPTVQSSKSGAPLAGTWAVLRYLGRSGYRKIARLLRDGTRRYIEGINSIEGLRVLGDPPMSLVAFDTGPVSPFALADAMLDRGWHIQPQTRIDDIRENIHLTIMPNTVDKVDRFTADLAASVEEVRDWRPEIDVQAVAGMLNDLDPGMLQPENVGRMMGMAGLGEEGLPKKMATVNAILNELRPEVADKLLTLFFNHIHEPQPE